MWDKPKLIMWAANLLYGLAAVLLLYALLFALLHLPIYPIRHIEVNGELLHVTREQVNLIVNRHLHGNFFTVDLVKTRDAFEKLPWVRNVSVRRRWPDKLEVLVEEHRELARYEDIALVNTHGEIFNAASDSDLPVFSGGKADMKEIAGRFHQFGQWLAPTGMKVTRVALSPRRAWQLGTNSGMTLELGRDRVETRLRKFASVYAMHLATQHLQIAYADLRYPNGFALRVPSAMLPQPKPVAAQPPKTVPVKKPAKTADVFEKNCFVGEVA